MISTLKRLAKRFLRRLSNDTSLLRLSSDERQLVEQVRERNLTYLSPKKLASIVQTCNAIEADGIEGAFLEAGCALGGSAIVISQVKEIDRPLKCLRCFWNDSASDRGGQPRRTRPVSDNCRG